MDTKGVIKFGAKKPHKHTTRLVIERHDTCRNPEDEMVPSDTLRKLRLLMHVARAAQWPSMDTFWTQHVDNTTATKANLQFFFKMFPRLQKMYINPL